MTNPKKDFVRGTMSTSMLYAVQVSGTTMQFSASAQTRAEAFRVHAVVCIVVPDACTFNIACWYS